MCWLEFTCLGCINKVSSICNLQVNLGFEFKYYRLCCLFFLLYLYIIQNHITNNYLEGSWKLYKENVLWIIIRSSPEQGASTEYPQQVFIVEIRKSGCFFLLCKKNALSEAPINFYAPASDDAGCI